MKIKLAHSGYSSLALLALTLGLACSEETSELPEGSGGNGSTTGAGASSQGGSTSTGISDGGSTFTTTGTGGNGTGGSCVDLVFEGEAIVKPADVVIIIDNSGSMNDEIASVEQNINVNFANILASSMLDYQVIMVADHGTGSYDVCIGPPLSGTTNCSGPPVEVANQFYHYDVNVQSHDAPCTLLDTLYGSAAGGRPVESGSDPNGIYTNGWSSFLRTEAVKVLVAITDDGIQCSCPGTYCTSPALSGVNLDDNDDTSQDPSTSDGASMALEFDKTLLGLAPAQFGSTADRNYVFHSIVGFPPKPTPTDPYLPSEPIVSGTCSSSGGDPSTTYAPGSGYQWLSKGTEGLRFPVCYFPSYDAVFQEIAAGVVEGAAVPCEFVIPDPGQGQELDLNTLLVEYTPGDGSPVEEFEKVASAAACGQSANAFYIEEDKIILCPNACGKVEDDNNAGVNVVAQCGGIAQ